jgi:hypothetical protein
MSMLFIGLLIALAAGVFAGVVLAQNWGGASHTIHGFGATLGSLTLAEIFLAGIILTAIFFLALWLASTSARMRRRASARRRAEHRSVREEHEAALADRDRLARELEAERARRGAVGTDTAAGYDAPPAGGYDEGAADPAYRSGPAYREAPAYPRDAEVYRDEPVERLERRDH